MNKQCPTTPGIDAEEREYCVLLQCKQALHVGSSSSEHEDIGGLRVFVMCTMPMVVMIECGIDGLMWRIQSQSNMSETGPIASEGASLVNSDVRAHSLCLHPRGGSWP